jgi:5'-nucleotidase
MNILVSNDDGYQAAGIICLVNKLRELGHEITVVAPDRNRSGASNSLTLDRPIRARTADNGFIYVDGTPTDCVHLAITGLLEHQPDMVIAGINAGQNLGVDALYSGTVAAVMEGRFLGLPAIAVSLAGRVFQHYATAATVVEQILTRMQLKTLTLPVNTILNVNVPDVPQAALKGMMITHLGNRHISDPAIKSQDPRGLPIYWVGAAGGPQNTTPGCDFHAVMDGWVSITPLHVDLTNYAALETMKTWITD